jgi:hypothetical protein
VAVNYSKAEKSVATRRAYATDFRLFKEWCDGKDAQSLLASPETVAAFLAAEAAAGVRPSTLGHLDFVWRPRWCPCRHQSP